MELIPTKLWMILGLTALALVINAASPILAAILGIVASVIFLWLLIGGR